MPNIGYDSDDAATGEYNRSKYNRSAVSPSNQKSSILKSSKKVQYSDDEDDNYPPNSGRLSNRRYEEPISSRSELMSAKPPS